MLFPLPAVRPAARASLLPAAAASRSVRPIHLTAPAQLPTTAKPDEEQKAKRPPSKYNLFVKKTFPTVKAANPTWNPKVIIKEVGRLWSESPENPKNA